MKFKFFASVVTLIIALLPGLLSAQSSDALKLGQEATEADANPQTLDLGPATAAPQGNTSAVPAPGQSAAAVGADSELIRTTHGSWEVACAKAGKPCVMAQIGNDKNGTPMLEMVVRKLPEPQSVQGVPVVAVTDIITPLGVVLTSGLTMKIDSSPEQRAPFQICTEQGCLVREPLTEEAVNRFIKGNKTKLTIVAAQQGAIDVTISLAGFTKAYNSLK